MSQFAALRFLKKRSEDGKPWVCASEVAEELDLSFGTASKNLSKLNRYGEARMRFDPRTGKRQFRYEKEAGI